ncbi:MAG: SDR family NAD(P)-dependent oxidoreductase [Sphingomonadaceae bacterium]|nr:SDR family NAD(P)-dependent oxidoreductase [Sphingomonadaceae bacterium]
MRRILITGGGSGLGEAVAALSVAAGDRVGLVGRSLDKLEAAQSRVGGRGAIDLFPVDVRDRPAVSAAVDRFRPDALVCCAAILARSDFWAAEADTAFDEAIAINLVGTQTCCVAAMRDWRARAITGDIVNVASLAGIRGRQLFTGFSAYASSKHAVVGLTEALALEGRPLGIRVNAVAPGAFASEMTRQLGFVTDRQPVTVAAIVRTLLDRAQTGALNGTTIEVENDE